MRVRTSVVSTIEGAVPRTSVGVGAQRRVPGVAGVAVGATARGVQPTPVGVEHDGALLRLAVVGRRALLDGQAGVAFCRERADLLAVGGRGEGESEESCCREHCGARSRCACREATVSSMLFVGHPW